MLRLGQKLHGLPRLKKYVKACQAGRDEKARKRLTYKDLTAFVQKTNLSTKYWMVRKAVVAFFYFGGHSISELQQMNQDCIEIHESGIVVKVPRSTGDVSNYLKDDN